MHPARRALLGHLYIVIGSTISPFIGYLYPNMAACETGCKLLLLNVHEIIISCLIFTITW